MKRSLVLSFCAAALVACFTHSAQADEITVTLDFDNSTWTLSAEVNDTAGDADGSFGISAVRALIDNVSFGGNNGTGITGVVVNGPSAIDPINTDNGPRAPVLLSSGSILDIIYAQNISAGGSITTGVGNSGAVEFASGTWAGEGATPSFALDDVLSTQGLFLGSATADGTVAIDPDANNLVVNDNRGGGDPDFFLLGDANNDGFVDGSDLGSVANTFGNVGAVTPHLEGDANHDGFVDGADLGSVANAFGDVALSGIAVVPEPSSFILLASFAGFAAITRRRKSC